jgi:hypothetical protein
MKGRKEEFKDKPIHQFISAIALGVTYIPSSISFYMIDQPKFLKQARTEIH